MNGGGGGGGEAVQNAATTDHRRYLGVSPVTPRDECAYKRDGRRELQMIYLHESSGGAWRSVALTRCRGSPRVDSKTDIERLPPAGT